MIEEATIDGLVGAVTALPSVAGLHLGAPVERAIYLPGRRITGVSHNRATGLHIHVVARGAPIDVADEVHATAARLGLRVHVVVEDLADGWTLPHRTAEDPRCTQMVSA